MYKAVIVGINAYPSAPLNGCVNDANDVIQYLVSSGLLAASDVLPLYDGRATKAAIVSSLRDMIALSRPGDNLLFQMSGHGTRIPSAAAADGYEEALCPVDFDWSDLSTAFTSNELIGIVGSLPSGVALTVVTDACHSGGLSKDEAQRPAGRPRYFAPPPDIAWIMQSRTREILARDFSSANAILIAACQADEVAEDTSFDGQPNGAFTHFWLQELAKGSATVSDVLTRVSADLLTFGMHPQCDGPQQLESATFLIAPPPLPRDLPRPAIVTRAVGVFDDSWSVTVFGTRIGVALDISIVNGGFDFQLSSNSGVPLRWSFTVNGNTSQRLDLGYGFALVLAVSGWTATPDTVGFELAVQIAPPFFGPVTVTQQHVTLPISPLPRALATPASAADLLAMIQLAQIPAQGPSAPPPPVTISRDPNQFTGIAFIENFSGGLFGCSYNKNSNDGGNSSYVPPGFIRDHVEVVLDPPGSGNVHFNKWNDSDPHIGNFEFHVGCSSCRGGRATFYLHCVPDPNVARQLPAPAPAIAAPPQPDKQLNGKARPRAIPEELAAADLLAGGSVRA